MPLLPVAAGIATAIGAVLPFVYISTISRPKPIRLAAITVGLAFLLLPLVVEHTSDAGSTADLYFWTAAGAIPALGGIGPVIAQRPRNR
ncbi:hypothetical protein ACFV4F_31905 [Kitasatospora sp. NPDC059722]|uniref:hypothetical protein n=1 Tax=Kitasatospora sp. NPDC059722 TaxID=3346925 RepID=UPI003686F243